MTRERIPYATYEIIKRYLDPSQDLYFKTHIKDPNGEPWQHTKLPCTLSLIHNDREIRARFVIGVENDKPLDLMVDMPIEAFNSLPVWTNNA